MLIWIDDDVIAVSSSGPSFLTPTKINRPGNSFANVARIYNYGTNIVYYGFGGNNNPPIAPVPASFKGIAIPVGSTVDIYVVDNLLNLQLICAATQTANLYVLYGSQ
jgi:hypothetical protein